VRQPSLVRRLVLLAAGWSLLILIGGALILTALYRNSSLTRFETGLDDLIDDLLAELRVDQAGNLMPPALSDTRAQRLYSGRYWQISEVKPDRSTKILMRSRSLWQSRLPLAPTDLQKMGTTPGATQYFPAKGPLGEPLMVGGQLVHIPRYRYPLVVATAEGRQLLDRDIAQFTATTIAALVLLGAGLILAILLQVRLGLQPLFRLEREVSAVRRGENERLLGTYSVELDPLARELNALMQHNQEVIERQRTHAGNLAHALKTPLSVILTEARQGGTGLAGVVEHQAELMRAQVDHHLRRARAAARSQSTGERTELAPILDELAVTLERIYETRSVEIDWRCPDDLYFQGERQDLLEIVGNVMDNACKWTGRRVRIEASPLDNEHLQIVIQDDGPGLLPEQRDAVLRRGERLDESAPGSGLGLSIVSDLVGAYGGSVSLDHASLGGLQVCLTLPRAVSAKV
jgi:signal transduction histidine kinase